MWGPGGSSYRLHHGPIESLGGGRETLLHATQTSSELHAPRTTTTSYFPFTYFAPRKGALAPKLCRWGLLVRLPQNPPPRDKHPVTGANLEKAIKGFPAPKYDGHGAMAQDADKREMHNASFVVACRVWLL